mgnify:CR=1 FL=1
MEIDGTPSGSITKTDPDYLQLRAKKIRDANHSLGRLSNSGIWKKHFHDNKLAVFQGQALDSAGGYRIRNSDHTGETELYITDRPSGRIRQGDSKSKYLAIQNGPEKMEDLIVKHDVDTVYASHGGEDILAMMDIDPDVKQIVVATPPKKKSKVSTLAKNRRPRMKVKPKNSTELYLDSVGGLDGVQLTNKIAYNPNDSFITKFKKGVRNGEQWIYNWLPPETKQKFFPSGNPMLRKNDPDRIAAGIILMEDKEARKKAAEGAAQMFEAYFGGKVAAEQYQVGGAAAALPAITGTGTAMALTNQAFNQDEFEDHYNSTALVPYEGEGGSTIMAPYIP